MRRLLRLLTLTLLAGLLLALAAFFLLPERVATLWQQMNLPPHLLSQAQNLSGQARDEDEESIRLYGLLEAPEYYAMSELDGRVERVLVEEGALVSAGQPLLQLDTAAVESEIAAAAAALEAAQAARAAATEPPSAARIAVAEAAVEAAASEKAGAKRSLAQAQAELADPQALTSQIDQTRALIPAAQAAVDAARAGSERIEVMLEEARRDNSREGKFRQSILAAQGAAAQADVEAEEARLAGLQQTLAQLQAIVAEPLALQAQANAAAQEVKLAQAALAVAEARASATAQPPGEAEVAGAEAQVQQARAALALARWALPRTTITAPTAGRISGRLIEAGEVIGAGAPLFSIVDPSRLEVRVYVALADLQRLRTGDVLAVRVLSQMEKEVQGTVTFIAPEAQFRPGNVLDPEERGDMVFLVKLRLDNEEGVLRAGMPVDVLLPPAIHSSQGEQEVE